MRNVGSVVAAAACALALAVGSSEARADAIPGPMSTCAKNEELVHDHDGERCLPKSCPPGKVLAEVGGKDRACVGPAPTNCPPGWKGVPGPHCMPDLCNGEVKTCGAGKTCKPSPICAADKEERLGRALSPTRTYAQGCDAQNACGVGESCRAVRTCLPADIDRLAAKPANALETRIVGVGYIPKDEGAYKGSKGPVPVASIDPTQAPALPGADASAPVALPPATTSSDAGAAPSSPPTVAPKSGRSGCATAPGTVPVSSPVVSFAAAAVLASFAARRRRRRAGAIALGMALGSFFALAPAHADVVPPSSVVCGKNEKLVVHHGGAHCQPTSCSGDKVLAAPGGGFLRCVDPAPKDCPAGWVGVPGPHCQLALCDDKTPCGAGTTCRESPVCTSDGSGYSELEPGERATRGAFAAPPAPKPYRSYAGPCDAELACGAREACRSVRVCLPRGVDRPAANAAHVLLVKRFGALPESEAPMAGGKPAASASPAPSSVAPVAPEIPSTPDAAPTSPATKQGEGAPAPVPPQPGRGTAGCAAAGQAGGGAHAVFAVFAALATARARRASRKEA